MASHWTVDAPRYAADLDRIAITCGDVNHNEVTSVIYDAATLDGVVGAAIAMTGLGHNTEFIPVGSDGVIPNLDDAEFWGDQSHVLVLGVTPRDVGDLDRLETVVDIVHVLECDTSNVDMLARRNAEPNPRQTWCNHTGFPSLSTASIAYLFMLETIEVGEWELEPWLGGCVTLDMLENRFKSDDLARIVLMVQEHATQTWCEEEGTRGGDFSRLFSQSLDRILTDTKRSHKDNLRLACDLVTHWSPDCVPADAAAIECVNKPDASSINIVNKLAATVDAIMEDPETHEEISISSSDLNSDTQERGGDVRAILLDVSILPDDTFTNLRVVGNMAVRRWKMPVLMVQMPLFKRRRPPIEVHVTARSTDDIRPSARGIALAHGGDGFRNAAEFKMMIGC